jgi:hypothetical protein
MSREQRTEAPPGLELLLRLVSAELAERRCGPCGGSLSNSKITLRSHDSQQVVIEVTCRACHEPLVLRVEPEAEEGTASVR